MSKTTQPFIIASMSFLAMLAGTASAQPSMANSGDDISYFLDQVDRAKADVAGLKVDVADLQRRIEADPNTRERDEIRKTESLISDLRNLRSEISENYPAYAVRPLEWLVRLAEQRRANQKQALAAKDATWDKEKAGITAQIAAKREALTMASDIQLIAERHLQEIRDERARASKSEELKALADTRQSETTGADGGAQPPPKSGTNMGKKPNSKEQK